MADVPADLAALLQGAFRYALSLTHDRSLADDLLQEACLSLIKADAAWDQGYLLSAVRSRFIDHHRRTRRTETANHRLAVRSENTLPFSGTEQADERRRLNAALGRLRAEEREALFLHAVGGYSADRIGVLTDQPRSTVLSLLQRGRRKLSEMLNSVEVCNG